MTATWQKLLQHLSLLAICKPCVDDAHFSATDRRSARRQRGSQAARSRGVARLGHDCQGPCGENIRAAWGLGSDDDYLHDQSHGRAVHCGRNFERSDHLADGVDPDLRGAQVDGLIDDGLRPGLDIPYTATGRLREALGRGGSAKGHRGLGSEPVNGFLLLRASGGGAEATQVPTTPCNHPGKST